MADILAGWAPTIILFALVIIAMQYGVAKQTKLIKSANENRDQQTAELRKIGETLERVASALEKQRNVNR